MKRSALCLWAACIASTAGWAVASGRLGGEPSGDSMVGQLGSANFAEREAAQTWLLQHSEVTLKDLEAALARPGLSLEQRTRLLSVARERFNATPRGALGVQFNSMEPLKAVIDKVFNHFPAAGFVQAGDEIVRINGQDVEKLGGYSSVKPLIISRDAGQVVELVIQRNGRQLNVSVPLGRYNDLPQAGRIDSWDMQTAWKERSAPYRAGEASADAIVPPKPDGGDEAWVNPGSPRRMAPRSIFNLPAFIVGGQPRGGRVQMDPADAVGARDDGGPGGGLVFQNEVWVNGKRVLQQRGNGNVMVQIGPNGQQQIIRQGQGAQQANMPDPRLFGELQRLLMSQARLQIEVANLQQLVNDPGVADEARKSAAEMLARRQQTLTETQKRIATLERLMQMDGQFPRP